MSLHCIVWCCMVLYCWLWRAGCISQDTYLLYVYLCSFFGHMCFLFICVLSFGHTCFLLLVTCVSSFRSHVFLPFHMCCKTKGKRYPALSENTKTFKLIYKTVGTFDKFETFDKFAGSQKVVLTCKRPSLKVLQKAPFEGFEKGPHLKVVKGLGQCRPGTVYDIWWPECSVHQQLYFTFFFLLFTQELAQEL